jgi:hypothetical protein
MALEVAESGEISTLIEIVSAEQSKKRAKKGINLNLTPRARELAEGIRAETGVPSTTALERFLEWLAEQDPKLVLAILNRDQTTQKQLMEDALAKAVGVQVSKADADMTPEQMAAAVRLLIGRLAAAAHRPGVFPALAATKKDRPS